jgi:hypothetical protein
LNFSLVVIAALTISGCESLAKIRPAPAPVSANASVPVKPAAAAERKSSRALFIIERNKNANVVHYDANLGPDGGLNPAEPVIAYWLLLAEDGRRKKLNWLERKKAYGVRIKPAPEFNGYTLTLAAAPWLPLSVKKVGADVRAEAAINDRPAVIEKMFIQSRERMMGPKVEYITLFGKDLETGEACSEKILPK